MMPSWAIFDYGEVIGQRTAALPSIARLLGVSEAELESAYWPLRADFDLGCPAVEYWQAVGAKLGADIDEDLANAANEMDVAGWLHPAQDTLALLDELAIAGMPMALLSNAPVVFAQRVRALANTQPQPWTRHFRHLMFSGELGMAKPAPQIWKELFTQIGAEPEDCVFLDDREPNVVGAREAGMRAHLWTGAADARDWLRSLTLLP